MTTKVRVFSKIEKELGFFNCRGFSFDLIPSIQIDYWKCRDKTWGGKVHFSWLIWEIVFTWEK